MIRNFILTLSILCPALAKDDTSTEIEFGVQIQGTRTTTVNKRYFTAFLAIPFAEAPIGKLRFKPPVPKVWAENIFNATTEGPVCPQTSPKNPDKVLGQEDCLVLNVYTHNTSKPLRKVMVFIHGGVFEKGTGNQYGPRRLMDRDLVLVTVNYRLGALGFLSTLDKASPGNYGLLDQTEALKWVQRNIEAFGGDPNKVTLFGESAGSVSVLDHCISPLSSGLFQRGIGQSGNVFNLMFAEQQNPTHWTNLLARNVGCWYPNTERIVDCLRQTPFERLLEASNLVSNGYVAFGPVNDGYFFSDLPSNLLRSGHITNRVPLMFGHNKNEGLFFVMRDLVTLSKPPKVSDQMISKYLGMSLNRDPHTIPIDVIKLVRKQYFDSPNLTNNTDLLLDAIVSMLTDYAFFSTDIETAMILTNNRINPYLYSFDYVTNHSILRTFGINKTMGVAHTDELSFLFDDIKNFPDVYNTPNDETEEKFMDIWTSFAENGYPTENTANGEIDWKPAQPGQINIYHLNREITRENYRPRKDWKIDFWLRQIPAEFAKTHTDI